MDEMKPILLTPETFQGCLDARNEFQSEKKCDMTLSLNRPDGQKASDKYIGKAHCCDAFYERISGGRK